MQIPDNKSFGLKLALYSLSFIIGLVTLILTSINFLHAKNVGITILSIILIVMSIINAVYKFLKTKQIILYFSKFENVLFIAIVILFTAAFSIKQIVDFQKGSTVYLFISAASVVLLSCLLELSIIDIFNLVCQFKDMRNLALQDYRGYEDSSPHKKELEQISLEMQQNKTLKAQLIKQSQMKYQEFNEEIEESESRVGKQKEKRMVQVDDMTDVKFEMMEKQQQKQSNLKDKQFKGFDDDKTDGL